MNRPLIHFTKPGRYSAVCKTCGVDFIFIVEQDDLDTGMTDCTNQNVECYQCWSKRPEIAALTPEKLREFARNYDWRRS